MAKAHALFLAVFLAVVTPALAHENDPHHHQSQHGGVVVESGHHHLEIVAGDGVLTVHVLGEDGKPEDVTGAKASATILSDGKKADVQLTPEKDGVLKGTGAFKAGTGTTVILTLTMPDHKPEQARIKLN